MNEIEQRYLRAIRGRVCQNCDDFLPDQVCGLTDRVCPIERNLLEIVQIAHYVRGDSRAPYMHELHSTVCAACQSSDATGRCSVRDAGKCPLDRYFMLVFEVIEEVHEQICAGHAVSN